MARQTADPAAMRAVAHPLRLQILEEMRDAGRPLRSADLAEMLGEPANSVSYHVRKLRDAGYVVDAAGPAGSTARDHWYRAPLPEDQGDDDGARAREQAQGTAVRTRYAQAAGYVLDAQVAQLAPQLHIDGSIWLTEDLARQYVSRLSALAQEMREASNEALETVEDGTELVRHLFLTDLVPESHRGQRVVRTVEEIAGTAADTED